MHGTSQIDYDQYRPFPFLAKEFRISGTAAGGDAPVDIARIVTGLIRPRFIELHATSAKMRDVGAGLQGIHAQYVERDDASRAREPDHLCLAYADRRGVGL